MPYFANNRVTKHEFGYFKMGSRVNYIEFSTDEDISTYYYNQNEMLICIIDTLYFTLRVQI